MNLSYGGKVSSLTEREWEVLSLLVRGESNKALAQQLGISPRTIQKHLQRIYAKLGVKGRLSAALLAAGATASRYGNLLAAILSLGWEQGEPSFVRVVLTVHEVGCGYAL